MSGPVVSTNVTIRMNEEELQRLDDLAQRMGKTRSDVIRDLISRFDEVLKEEVEKERRKWMAIGFVGALESAVLDPEVIVRFVRRNVDVLGYPDFLIGMVRVRNRVVVFSHHDKIGSQLLSLVRSRIEEEVRKEEKEIEREGGEDEDTDSAGASKMPVVIRRGAHQRTPRAIPVAAKYKLISNNKGAPPTVKPTAISTVGRVTTNNGGGAAKPTVAVSVPENQKLVATSSPNAGNPANSQTRNPNPQATASGSDPNAAGPNGQAPTDRPVGDFAFALVANLYHKRRESLLRFIEALVGG